jgi:streptomycin 3"-adenylyltransferase
VFPPIPAADYRSSILSDFKWAGEHLDESPLYAVLNACRVLAYVKEGKICSKQQAGEWATQELPAERATIIRAALEAYSRNGRLPGVSREMLRAFIVAIGNEIAEAG